MDNRRCDEGTMVLILGIVSAVFALVGPAAVIMGNRAMPHLAHGTQQYNHARTGWIIGWLATGYLALFTLIFTVALGFQALLMLGLVFAH